MGGAQLACSGGSPSAIQREWVIIGRPRISRVAGEGNSLVNAVDLSDNCIRPYKEVLRVAGGGRDLRPSGRKVPWGRPRKGGARPCSPWGRGNEGSLRARPTCVEAIRRIHSRND